MKVLLKWLHVNKTIHDCVAWSCDTLLSISLSGGGVDKKVPQLHATQSEPLDFFYICINEVAKLFAVFTAVVIKIYDLFIILKIDWNSNVFWLNMLKDFICHL